MPLLASELMTHVNMQFTLFNIRQYGTVSTYNRSNTARLKTRKLSPALIHSPTWHHYNHVGFSGCGLVGMATWRRLRTCDAFHCDSSVRFVLCTLTHRRRAIFNMNTSMVARKCKQKRVETALLSSCRHYLLPERRDASVTGGLRRARTFEPLTIRTVKFRNSFIPHCL